MLVISVILVGSGNINIGNICLSLVSLISVYP